MSSLAAPQVTLADTLIHFQLSIASLHRNMGCMRCDQRHWIPKCFESGGGVDGDADASTDAHGTKHATSSSGPTRKVQVEARRRPKMGEWDATRPPLMYVSEVPPGRS